MQVFVVGLDGETFPVEVCGVEARVEEVQRQVELVEGVPPELQRLTFQGRELQRGCALRDYNVTEHSSLHLTMDLDGGRDQYNWLKYIATKALTHKKICRKCYGRLSPNATRCHKAKCGRTSDIRPKKLPFMRRYWYNLNRPYTDACRWGW